MTTLVPSCSQWVTEKKGWKAGNVLFNNAFNTFYLWLYGVELMVMNHSDSEREPSAATSWVTLFNLQQGIFYMHHTTKNPSTYYCFCYTCCGVLEQEIVQWVHHQGLVPHPTVPGADTLSWSYVWKQKTQCQKLHAWQACSTSACCTWQVSDKRGPDTLLHISLIWVGDDISSPVNSSGVIQGRWWGSPLNIQLQQHKFFKCFSS